MRPADIEYTSADPKLAEDTIGWKAKHSMYGVIEKLLTFEKVDLTTKKSLDA
jgi:GDP-D-mannose dehydratase